MVATGIALIGMPAVGKSTIARHLAKALRYKVIDIDEVIEKKHGMKIQDVLGKIGPKQFILEEERNVLKIKDFHNVLVAPGGSIIYSAKSMAHLRKKTTVVLLTDSYLRIKKRLYGRENRAIIGIERGLRRLYIERMKLYKKYAQLTVKVPHMLDTRSIRKNILEPVLKTL